MSDAFDRGLVRPDLCRQCAKKADSYDTGSGTGRLLKSRQFLLTCPSILTSWSFFFFFSPLAKLSQITVKIITSYSRLDELSSYCLRLILTLVHSSLAWQTYLRIKKPSFCPLELDNKVTIKRWFCCSGNQTDCLLTLIMHFVILCLSWTKIVTGQKIEMHFSHYFSKQYYGSCLHNATHIAKVKAPSVHFYGKCQQNAIYIQQHLVHFYGRYEHDKKNTDHWADEPLAVYSFSPLLSSLFYCHLFFISVAREYFC